MDQEKFRQGGIDSHQIPFSYHNTNNYPKSKNKIKKQKRFHTYMIPIQRRTARIIKTKYHHFHPLLFELSSSLLLFLLPPPPEFFGIPKITPLSTLYDSVHCVSEIDDVTWIKFPEGPATNNLTSILLF